jgi:hypothetical protein
MTLQLAYLVDSAQARIAVLDVTPTGDHYSGTICLDATPPPLRSLFEEFEERVEGQMFNLADESEEIIGALPLRVVFANGTEAYLQDLQVFPSTKRVSFKVRQASAAAK